MRDWFSRAPHAAGLALGIFGIVILSPDALLLRLLAENGADDAAVVSGRAAWAALTTGMLCAFFPGTRREWRWRPILIYALFFASGLSCFPLSIQRTYTANTLILLATTPMLAAAGARIFLGEKVARQTWAAAIAAGAGAGFLMANETGAGRLEGDVFALLAAASLAGGAVTIRGGGERGCCRGVVLGSVLTAAGWGFFADWGTVADARGGFLLFLDGAIVVSLSLTLITIAARLLPPPETGLIFLLETGLGPLWVWLVLHERPPWSSLLAGAFIAAVLIAHSVWALRSRAKITRKKSF